MRHWMLVLLLLGLPSISVAHGPHDLTDWRKDLAKNRSPRVLPLPKLAPAVLEDYNDPGIRPETLKTKLSELSGAVPVTIDGQAVRIAERGSASGRELARRYLEREYRSIGFEVSTHEYRTGKNFIAEKKGTDPSLPVLILSSHLDSVRNAGANDDGIGTVGALAIAQYLAPLPLKRTVRVLAFDEEESGLVGSRAYVTSIGRSAPVLANIHLEMMGVDSDRDGHFHVIDCGKGASVPYANEVMNAVAALRLPLKRVSACTSASDHSVFWSAGFPAIVMSENFFGGDSDPCYHRSCDVVDDRIDFTYASQILRAVGSAVEKLAR